MLRQLSPSDLAWRCEEEWLPWERSAEVEPATGIVGQNRAVEAIGFGLGMSGVGYDVFVTGLAGTGRQTTSRPPNADLSENPILLCYKYLNSSHAVMT